jgi:hypothetical protein
MDARMTKTESDSLWSKAEQRLDEIMKQYAGIPKGEHAHTDYFIFPSAAIYLTLKEAVGEEVAYSVIENAAIKGSVEIGKKLARLMRLPGMKSLFVRIWDPMTKKMFGPDRGFKNVFYPKKKGEYRMDIVACPYYRYFTELGCPEITKISCSNDDRCYGNLPAWNSNEPGPLVPVRTAAISI